MKGVGNLLVYCAIFVTLLLLMDAADAKKKESNVKDAESKNFEENSNFQNEKFEKKSKYDTVKKQNVKRSTENIEEDSKTETKKYKVKKDTKYTIKKDSTNINVEKTPKITKTYQKVKKYKVVEDEPAQKSGSSKTKAKKTKQKVAKEETVDKIYKSVKKTSQKKLSQEDNIERVFEDGLNQLNEEENIIDNEENPANTQKKRKYKLVELVLEENPEEDTEGNETVIEVGSEDEELANIKRTEREEVIEKMKTTYTVKKPKTRKTTKVFVEEDQNEDVNMTEETLESSFREEPSSDVEHPASKYENPEPLPVCTPLPEDPERQGPKKLTLYVIEEEVDGYVKKRVVSEEDGVTMCEVADLLKDHYYAGLF